MPQVDGRPASGAQSVPSWIVSPMVSGIPSATVVDDPKLERMSLRTTPLSARTFGPFEPSPG